eukprot:2891755-Amphidinium_carterae.1
MAFSFNSCNIVGILDVLLRVVLCCLTATGSAHAGAWYVWRTFEGIAATLYQDSCLQGPEWRQATLGRLPWSHLLTLRLLLN